MRPRSIWRCARRAGLFDLGDTGLVELAGGDALAAVQSMTSNDAGRLHVGQVQHSALTTRDGTFLDELLVYRLAASHFLLTVNAVEPEEGRPVDPRTGEGLR